jgi:hypothetical protein
MPYPFESAKAENPLLSPDQLDVAVQGIFVLTQMDS